MYSVYSQKNKKIGSLDSSGTLTTLSKKLQNVYDTMLNMGVYSYSTKRSKKIIEIVRKPVRQEDGKVFLLALIDNLDYLGFIIKED
jgi:hypothetical protein